MVSDQASGWIKALALAGALAVPALGVGLWLVWRKGYTLRLLYFAIPDVVKVAALSSVTYVLFLMVSISLVDANTPLDQRLLSPLFVFLLVPVGYGIHCWNSLIGRRHAFRALLVSLVAIGCLGQAAMSYPLLERSYREGQGFSNGRWAESELIRALRESRDREALYSNSADAVSFLTGREAKQIPVPFFSTTQQVNSDYEHELSKMREALTNGGVLVILNVAPAGAPGHARKLARDLGLAVLRRYPDGEVLGCPEGMGD
jgi:hypothetical protein